MRKAIAFYLVSYVLVTFTFAQPDVQNLTTEQWHEDIATLVERLESMHPNPYAHISKQAFDAQLEAIRNELPALEHHEIVVKLMQLVALLQDGHTNLIPTGSNGFNSWFPVRFYRFSDGLFITAIDKSQSDLVAGHVLRIGNRSAEDAHKLAASLVGTDNEMGKLEAIWYLSSPAALAALKVNDSLKRLPLRVKTRQGEVRDIELEARTSKFHLEWRFWGEMFGPPGMDGVTAFAGKAPAGFLNPEANPDLPLHLRGRRAFWFTFLDDKEAVYMQINSVTNQSRHTHETFEQMYQRMFDLIDQNEDKVERFILDIRYNSGGNGRLVTKFVHEFIKREHSINRPGCLFTLVGRKTFSAAVMLMAEMKKHTYTMFAGEPAGAPLNSYGDHGHVLLPNSGLSAKISTLYWQLSTSDDTSWVEPVQIPAVFSSDDYFAGRDPALDLIFADEAYQPVTTLLQENSSRVALAVYEQRAKEFAKYPWWQPFTEEQMNTLGYDLLQGGRIEDAIAAFRLNTERFSASWNCFDSLAEAYMKAEQYDLAILSYTRALEINPHNWNAANQRKHIEMMQKQLGSK